MSLSYISADSLAKLLDSGGQTSGQVVILDVRDSDFAGGNIRGAVNIPSEEFRRRIPEINSRFGHVETLVVHCMMSQMRGPTCAKMLAHEVERNGTNQKILILRDGFSGWVRFSRVSHPHLLENFVPEFYD